MLTMDEVFIFRARNGYTNILYYPPYFSKSTVQKSVIRASVTESPPLLWNIYTKKNNKTQYSLITIE